MDKQLIRDYLNAMDNMRKVFFYHKIPNNMPRGEFTMLDMIQYLTEDGIKVTTSAISKVLMISKSAVSQSINAVEKKGLVERTIDPYDKRVYRVSLTDDGKNALKSAKEHNIQIAETLLSHLNDDDVKSLIRISENVCSIVKDFIAENSFESIKSDIAE